MCPQSENPGGSRGVSRPEQLRDLNDILFEASISFMTSVPVILFAEHGHSKHKSKIFVMVIEKKKC
jgi:hypothetical protein